MRERSHDAERQLRPSLSAPYYRNLPALATGSLTPFLRGLLHLRSKTAGPGRSEELLFHQRQVAEVHVAVAIEIRIRISEVDDHVLVEIRVAEVAESIVICVLLIGVEHPRAIVAGITSRISAG